MHYPVFSRTTTGLDETTGNLLVDYAENDCGGYTGIAVDEARDSSSGSSSRSSSGSSSSSPLLYASTITGGLYALQLEAGIAASTSMATKEGDSRKESGVLRLRCIGFVHGSTIV